MEAEGIVGPGEGAKPREVYGGAYGDSSLFNNLDKTSDDKKEI